MEISVSEQDGGLYFRIMKYDEALDKTFKNHGYVKTGEAYEKSFPAAFPFKDKIIENYRKNAENMLCEEAGLKPMKWQKGFEQFALIANKAGLDWWTTGRILLPLNGIDAEINDVDFYFHSRDLDRVYDAFSDYIIEPVVSDTWRANTFRYYGLAYLHCAICIFADPLEALDIPEPVHYGRYASKNLITVKWRGIDVKIPPVELYIMTLRKWGMNEAAQSIIDALSQNEDSV